MPPSDDRSDAARLAPPARPPQGYFGVWQRLLRGYGPVAVFAVLVLLVALLVPSKVQKASSSPTSDNGSGSQSLSGDQSGTGSGAGAGGATT
ncbi:MAG: hypothetical protein ACR2KC_07545, partial [Acidimicrobiales bacterium]